MKGKPAGVGGTVARLVLVNKDNPIPPGYQESLDLVEIEVNPGFSVPLEREAAQKYLELKRRFASLGIRVELLSGYRFQKTQERIWNESVIEHGEEHTARHVAKPGYSEHQTGLALDLTLYDAWGDEVADDDIEAYEALFPHLSEFGFILRYPAGKEDVTGYAFEPWHIRYVGAEAARDIYESGWTLEEYVSKKES